MKRGTEKFNVVHKEISRIRRALICIGIERMVPLRQDFILRKSNFVKMMILIMFSPSGKQIQSKVQQMILEYHGPFQAGSQPWQCHSQWANFRVIKDASKKES